MFVRKEESKNRRKNTFRNLEAAISFITQMFYVVQRALFTAVSVAENRRAVLF